MRRRATLVGLVMAVAALPGCTLGTFETARTTPRGSLAMEVSHNVVLNENTSEQPGIFAYHPEVALRAGATDHLDLGLRLLMGAGGLVDVKYNVFGPESRLALAFQGGFGAAGDWDDEHAFTLHLPLRILVSYLAWDRFEPFVSLGYGFFWVFGREQSAQEGVSYAARRGYGDGVLTVTVGARVVLYDRDRSTGMLAAGYSFWWAAVDDPGDFYSFVNNHFFGLAYTVEFHFRRHREQPPEAQSVDRETDASGQEGSPDPFDER